MEPSPEQLAVLIRSSTQFIREGRPFKALQLLLKAHEAYGPQPNILLALGTTAFLLEEFPSAYGLLAEAHILAPEDLSILVNLAHAAEKTGHLPELMPELEKAATQHPQDEDLAVLTAKK
jgi:tetratricopeptide (TPR) repeat protein